MQRGMGYVSRENVVKSENLVNTWKVLVPKAFNGGDGFCRTKYWVNRY